MKPNSVTKSASTITALILLLSINLQVQAKENNDINWSITPYFWASDTALDISVNEANINGGLEIPFDDLLDTVDVAFQGHVEYGKGKWSGFSDITYLETSDTLDRPLLNIDTESKQTVIDAAVAYWPNGAGSKLNVYGGVRYTGFDDRYEILLGADPLAVSRSKSDYYDALLGMRYRFDLSERWSFLTRADLSFGDSEGTWLAQGLFAYSIGERKQNRILFGYQYKQAEFEDDGLNQDFTYDGVMAGFNFRF